MVELPPRSLHFVLVVQTTRGCIRGYGHLVKRNCPWTSIWDSQTTLWQWWNIQYFSSPSVTILHRKMTESQSLCTRWTTPLVTAVRNSCAHAQNRMCMLTVPNSEAGISIIVKKYGTHKTMYSLPLTHKFALDTKRWSKDRDIAPNTVYHGGCSVKGGTNF